MSLIPEIEAFLAGNGVSCCRVGGGIIRLEHGGYTAEVIPVGISSGSPAEAEEVRREVEGLISGMDKRPMVITEDRWRLSRDMMEKRLLAHVGIFTGIYARDCEVRRIGKDVANMFLDKCHSYGKASSRYSYGVFIMRPRPGNGYGEGTLVAAAQFSNARRWQKGDRTVRSYEWIRYASLPDVRVTGGMGKILCRFIDDVSPDDIMSYADLEWSDGDVYRRLGFFEDGNRDPVLFSIDTDTWIRTTVRPDTVHGGLPSEGPSGYLKNYGSIKFRMKLTDY